MPSGYGISEPVNTSKNRQRFRQVLPKSSSNSNSSSTKISFYKPSQTNKLKPEIRSSSKSCSSSDSSSTSMAKEAACISQLGKMNVSTSSSTTSSDYEVKKVCNTSSNGTKHKKVGCTCPPCLKWDVNDINNKDNETFIDSQEKCRKVIMKPPLLFKTKEEEKEKLK